MAVVLGVGPLAFVLMGNKDDRGESADSETTDARLVSVEELQQLTSARDRPVFWAGPRSGSKYELTETKDGSVYVRYLSEDADAGDPSPSYLTVATYPLDDGYQRVAEASKGRGTETTELQDGGLALVDSGRPSSVYLAYPRGNCQVEVYDPSPEVAMGLVMAGAIQPVR